MNKLFNKIYQKLIPHYVVIGKNTKEIIGCCKGSKGRAEVMSQELGATFERRLRKNCPICQELKELSVKLEENINGSSM